METLYRKVEIKSEQDLPEDGIYFVHSIKSGLITEYSYHDNPNVWMGRINWYLQPVEPQEPKCEECPSKQFYEANTAKIMDNIEQPEISVTDEEISNAANKYWKNDIKKNPDHLPFAPSFYNAYEKGAKAARDGKIQSKRVK